MPFLLATVFPCFSCRFRATLNEISSTYKMCHVTAGVHPELKLQQAETEAVLCSCKQEQNLEAGCSSQQVSSFVCLFVCLRFLCLLLTFLFG